MMMCREASWLISVSNQRQLHWREQIALRMHLAMCDACRNFKKQMTLLTNAAQRFVLQEETFSQFQLADDARQRIRTTLVSQQGDRKDS